MNKSLLPALLSLVLPCCEEPHKEKEVKFVTNTKELLDSLDKTLATVKVAQDKLAAGDPFQKRRDELEAENQRQAWLRERLAVALAQEAKLMKYKEEADIVEVNQQVARGYLTDLEGRNKINEIRLKSLMDAAGVEEPKPKRRGF
jgi:hypothetical protein